MAAALVQGWKLAHTLCWSKEQDQEQFLLESSLVAAWKSKWRVWRIAAACALLSLSSSNTAVLLPWW